MDDFVQEQLNQWGFGSYIPIFIEQEIDEVAFRSIDQQMIESLFKKLGPRKKFEIKFKENFPSTETTKHVESGELTDDLLSASTSESGDISEKTTEQGETVHYRHHAYLGRENESIAASTVVTTELLAPILLSDEGSEIIAEYNKTKRLDRAKLCSLIIKEELKENKDKRISTTVLKQYSQEIHDIFPNEIPETYFSSYFRNSKGTIQSASGKLWDKYINRRKYFKRIGLIPDKKQKTNENTASTSSLLEGQSLDEDIQWLKNNSEPFPEVLSRWKSTFDVRMSSSNQSIDTYVKEFSGLRQPLGYLLFESDFETIYNDKKNSFIINWPLLHKNILKIASTKKDAYLKEYLSTHSEADTENLAALVLPLLFTPPHIKTKKGNFKLSKIEQQDSFILHVDCIANLEICVERKRKLCEKFGTTKQPLPIYMGTLENIEACYVNVNTQNFKVDTLSKAIDTCFKIFHAISAQYPVEAECSWLFIQKAIYNFDTEFDKHFISVTTLISDITQTTQTE